MSKQHENRNMKIHNLLKPAFCLLVGTSLVAPLRAADKELKSVAVTVGDLGNPFFVQIAHGAEAKAKEINPKVKFGALSSNYDVNKQTNDVDNLISSGTTLLLLESAKFRGQNVIGIKMPNAPKR
jgi:ribose transport system substrate-binding protein